MVYVQYGDQNYENAPNDKSFPVDLIQFVDVGQMTFPSNDPHFRVYVTPPRLWRFAGCAGCLVLLFILGGMAGVLLLGWKALLGL